MGKAISLPLPDLMLTEIAACLAAGESRAAFIRAAIETELFRRQTPPQTREAAA